MEVVSAKDVESVRVEIQEENSRSPIIEVNDSNFEQMLESMNNPVLAQKEIAVKVKAYLDLQMAKELEERGYLTESTRKWVDSFNKICENIQKALHGDKSVNLHIHKVSHSDIANKIRKA